MKTKDVGNTLEKIGKTKKTVMVWVLVALVIVGIIIGATMCRGEAEAAPRPAVSQPAG